MGAVIRIGLLLLIGGCGGATTKPASDAKPIRYVVPEAADQDLTASDTMWHHFVDVGQARDAVIGGQLEKARMPFNRLAAGDYGTSTRPEWAPDLERMQAAARRGAEAKDLLGAARAAAAVAGHCGACHQARGKGPEMQGRPQGYRPRGHAGLSEDMRRQVWAAEEMWLGITVPLDAAWQRGAQTLAGRDAAAPVQPVDGGVPGGADVASEPAPSSPSPPPSETQQAVVGLRALGERAVAVSTAAEREVLYAELIAQCGGCHVEKGIHVFRRRTQ